MEKYILLLAFWIGCIHVNAETPIGNCAACQVVLSQKDDISCFGRTDGLLRVAPFNCKGKVSYLWSNGAKTSEIKNLPPGKYAVVVTDEDGSKANGSWEINEPSKLTVDGSQLDPLCYGDATGTIYPNVNGGTPMYSFKWSNGETVQYINSLKSGKYTLTVTDDNGCTAVKSWTIKDPDKVEVVVDFQKDVSCKGGNDGEIHVFGEGGTGKYTFSWSTGSTSSKLTNLKAGAYTVTVYDEYLCEGTATLTIKEPTKLTVKTVQLVNVSCAGEGDGRIEVDGNGGTPGYNFSWSTGATTSKITNLNAGSYEVTVTDKNGCKAIEKYSITEPGKLNVSLKSRKNNLCFGEKKGEMEVTPSGGTPPYNYSWSNGAKTALITGLPAGAYELTLTDNNLCEIKVTYNITEPTELTSSLVQIINVDCFGDKNGSIEVVGKGGTPPYTYKWSNGLNGSLIKNLGAGSFDVTIFDNNDCEVTETYKVSEPDQLVSSLINKKDNTCNGDNMGEIEVEAIGGTPPYSYSWSSGQATPKISGLAGGNYELTITDDNKCEVTVTYEILEPSAVAVELLRLEDVLCHGDHTGLIGVVGRGGTPDYSYSWSNGGTTGQIDRLPEGGYKVTVEDKNGCEATASYPISEPDTLILETIALVHNSCGAMNQGEIEVELNGGVAPYTYLWSTGATTQRITNLATGMYSVEAKDDNGCFINAEFEVEETDDLLPSKEIITHISCHGEEDGSIELFMDGGVPPYTYLWSSGQTTSRISDLAPGGYNVVVRDANGCSFDKTYLILEPDALVVADVEVRNMTCHADTAGFIAIKVEGGTGTRYVKWTYRPASEQNFNIYYDGLLTKYDTLDSLAAGSYAMELRDDNDCIVQDTFKIVEPTKIEMVSQGVNDARCNGEESGSIKVSLKGGSNIYFVKWTYRSAPGAKPNLYDEIDGVTGDTLYNLAVGTYFLEAQDTNGCIYMDSFQINAPLALEIEELTKTDLLCHGDSSGTIAIKIAGGTGPYNIQWTYDSPAGPMLIKNSSNITEDELSDLSGGLVQINILDENKCALVDSIEVIEPDAIVRMGGLLESPLCHGDSTGRIVVEYVGGTNINLVKWTYRSDAAGSFTPYQTTHDQSTDSIVDALAGEYQIRVSDENNCINESVIPLAQPDKMDYVVEEVVPSNGANGEIHLLSEGGWGSYEYEWSGPGGFTSMDKDITGLVPGDYQCFILDAVQCELTTETINVPLSTWTRNQLDGISKIYPVPARSEIHIDFKDASFERESYLVDINGKLISPLNLESQKNTINIDHLQSGDYIILVLQDGQKYAQKVSKL